MTAVILAGGKSRRMGRDKLLLPLSGERLLDRAVRRYREVFPRVLVSVSGPERYPELGEARVCDRYPGAGPLAGLHAGLLASGDDVFLTGADMPFSSPEKALQLISLCGEKEACVLTDADGRWEPCSASTAKACWTGRKGFWRTGSGAWPPCSPGQSFGRSASGSWARGKTAACS